MNCRYAKSLDNPPFVIGTQRPKVTQVFCVAVVLLAGLTTTRGGVTRPLNATLNLIEEAVRRKTDLREMYTLTESFTNIYP